MHSPYTSDTETSTTTDEDDDIHVQPPRPTQSLGRMLPVPTHQLTPEFNAVRQHTVVEWVV